jgi:hypothetical protein
MPSPSPSLSAAPSISSAPSNAPTSTISSTPASNAAGVTSSQRHYWRLILVAGAVLYACC